MAEQPELNPGQASRRREFAAGHDDARPDLKVDYVYEGEPLESNYKRNRYGDDA